MSEDLLEALEAANEAIREGCENVLELAKEIELRDAAITTLRDELTNCAETLQAVRDDREKVLVIVNQYAEDREFLRQRVAELETAARALIARADAHEEEYGDKFFPREFDALRAALAQEPKP